MTGCLKGKEGSGLPGAGDYACHWPQYCRAPIGPDISRFVILGDWRPGFRFVCALAAGAVKAGAPAPREFEPRVDLKADVSYVP